MPKVLCGTIILDKGEDATGFCIVDNVPSHRGVEDMNCNEFLKSRGSQCTTIFYLSWKLLFRAGRLQ